MSQYNKERHAAAMLVHNIGSAIEALNDLPRDIALENIEVLEKDFMALGEFIVRLCEIERAKYKRVRVHQ